MNFKFLHAADLHLDSPLKRLARYEGAPVDELRSAPRAALRNLVSLAIEEKVDFVLIAGDLYDGDWKDYNTGLFLNQRLKELQSASIPVYLVKGNHDAESRITRHLTLPDNVKMFGDRHPQTAKIEELNVAIHGQSFTRPNVEENLAANYPEPVKGFFNIGLLHTSADGREGHANYAPCSVESLKARGYDYWALGHIHKREILCQDPWIVFPGNIQGRHIKETGDKGATLVTVEDYEVVAVEHQPLDVARWKLVKVDVTDIDHPSEMMDQVRAVLQEAIEEAEDRLLAVRLEIYGRCRAHNQLQLERERWVNELRALAGGRVWLEKIRLKTLNEVSESALAQRSDAYAVLMGSLQTVENDMSALEELGKTLFTALEQKLPAELRRGDESLQPAHPALIRELMPQVRQFLETRLAGESEESQ